MTNTYLSIATTLAVYTIMVKISERLKNPLANPLFWSSVLMIPLVYLLRIPYETYFTATTPFDLLLLLATVSLAVPLDKNMELLKKNVVPILGGVLVGVVISLGTIILFSKLLSIDRDLIIALLPKSITTGMAIPLIDEIRGYSAITALSVIITGVSGAVMGPNLFKALRIDDPVAIGVAMGTTSHVAGTAIAYEMGEVEGSIASLCIALTGIITIIAFPLALQLL